MSRFGSGEIRNPDQIGLIKQVNELGSDLKALFMFARSKLDIRFFQAFQVFNFIKEK